MAKKRTGDIALANALTVDTQMAQLASSSVVLPVGGVDLEHLIREVIMQALVYTGGMKSKAAELLRVSPRVLSYDLKRYSVPDDHGKRKEQ